MITDGGSWTTIGIFSAIAIAFMLFIWWLIRRARDKDNG
jgi:hypothetical protein